MTAIKGRYNNTVTFAHDEAGRLASESLTIDGNTYTVTHSFDQAGRQAGTTYPDGSIVSRTFTSRGQLQQVDYDGDGPGGDPASLVAAFQYDPGHRETQRTHGNGIVTNRTYTRSDNLVTSIDVPGHPGLSFAYTYDKNKNVSSETTGGVMSGYSFTAGYDNEDRLASWTRNNGDSQSWTLTPVGDWQQFTENGAAENRTHGPTHELTTIDTQPLTCDPKGNLLSTLDSGLSTLYSWDMDNMLASATIPAGSSKGIEGTHAYEYDALGRRVAKVVNDTAASASTRTVFLYMTQPIQDSPNASQVVTEYESLDGAVLTLARNFVYGTYIDEPLVLIDRTSHGSQPPETDEAIYYHQHRLYSVTGLTGSSAAILERYVYTAYGQLTVLDADGIFAGPSSSLQSAYAFTGQVLGAETGIYCYRARCYDPALGRFLTPDPSGFRDSFNQYEYGQSTPTDRVDPSGLACQVCFKPVKLEEDVQGRGPVNPFNHTVACIYKWVEDTQNVKNRQARKKLMPSEKADCCDPINNCNDPDMLKSPITRTYSVPPIDGKCPAPDKRASDCPFFVAKNCTDRVSLKDCLAECDKGGDYMKGICAPFKGTYKTICKMVMKKATVQVCRDYCIMSTFEVQKDGD